MNKTIAVIRGDGIGPEIVEEAVGVLDAVAAARPDLPLEREERPQTSI